jgi:hypothetical protein
MMPQEHLLILEDSYRFSAFKSAFAAVTNEASVLTGSKLVDNSKIYHSDANYNLKT